MRHLRARSEEMTMQQIMGMMQGLQEAMAASKAEQERMQAYLTANDELHRANEELRCGWRDVDEPETATPPREFLNTILTGNPRDSNPQHIHGAQSNLHRDGGS